MFQGKESDYRKRARSVVTKTGHHLGKLGGHMRNHEPANGDYAEDKKLVDSEIKKAMHEHDAQLHGKGYHTRLKLAEGGSADGPMASPRSDQAPRGKSKGQGKAHTNVNVIVAGGRGQAPPQPIPVPVPHPTPAGGPTPPPSMPPGGPPPGAMPPAMPMGVAPQVPPRPPMPPPGGMPPGMPMRKAGGRATIAREAKEEGESYAHEAAEHGKRAAGGRAYSPPKMTAGSASGEGRLAKARLSR